MYALRTRKLAEVEHERRKEALQLAEGAFTALGGPHHTTPAPAAAAGTSAGDVEAWDTVYCQARHGRVVYGLSRTRREAW
jgi:hypothetical protein